MTYHGQTGNAVSDHIHSMSCCDRNPRYRTKEALDRCFASDPSRWSKVPLVTMAQTLNSGPSLAAALRGFILTAFVAD